MARPEGGGERQPGGTPRGRPDGWRTARWAPRRAWRSRRVSAASVEESAATGAANRERTRRPFASRGDAANRGIRAIAIVLGMETATDRETAIDRRDRVSPVRAAAGRDRVNAAATASRAIRAIERRDQDRRDGERRDADRRHAGSARHGARRRRAPRRGIARRRVLSERSVSGGRVSCKRAARGRAP